MVYEQTPQGPALLVLRMRVSGEAEAARFVEAYGDLLEKKYPNRTSIDRHPGSIFFELPAGGSFIRCVGRDCLLGEGATRVQFEGLARAMGWAMNPLSASASTFAPAMAALAAR